MVMISGNAAGAADLGVPPGSPTASIVAALREPKGHEIAMRAWLAVLESVPDAHLLVVGDGDHRTDLEKFSKDHGPEERVVIGGSLADVLEVWRASTLAALPSYIEARPTAVAEAACGLASVATTVGGIPEAVRGGVTGPLVPPHDVGAFAAAVSSLLLDGDRRHHRVAARRDVEQKFDRELWIERLLALYDPLKGTGVVPGVEVDVFTRTIGSALPPGVVEAADGVRLHHVSAAPFGGLTRQELPATRRPSLDRDKGGTRNPAKQSSMCAASRPDRWGHTQSGLIES